MADELEQMLADTREADAAKIPAQKDLDDLGMLVNRMYFLEREIQVASKKVEDYKNELDTLMMKSIPDLMKKTKIRGFDLDDGSTINIKTIYAGSISEEHRDAAFTWLRDNKHGDLIKNQITVALGMKEDEKAAKIEKVLEEEKVQYTVKESVHPGTLGAFLKEQTEAGNVNLPLVLLGAFIQDVAKVTRSKPKKEKA